MRQILIVAFLLAFVGADALARDAAPPKSQELKLALTAPTVALTMRNAKDLLAEDAKQPAGRPLRFAQPIKVSVNAGEHGRWHRLPDGSWLWTVQFNVPGATDINLGLTRFKLPQGAALHVIGANGYYQGPYTHENNRKHGQLWLPVVPGSRARLELHVPDREDEFEVQIGRVSAGYRDVFVTGLAKIESNAKTHGSCNIDVACSLADAWRDEVRSVSRYSIDGQFLCTGTLVMDAARSFMPYLLSAAHCTVNAANASTIVAYWNYQSPSCGQQGGGSLSQNQVGSIFRASRIDVDMLLLELDEVPLESFNLYYAGWDRGSVAPASSIGIHHPEGDVKSISFNDDALTTMNSCIESGTTNTHWRVDNWEQGTTEQGSSGSALFNPANQRIVGFLSGGTASCADTTGFDCYGKVSVAWDGAAADQRLKDRLDPTNSGIAGMDGADPGVIAMVTASRFVDACGAASGNGTAQPGETLDLFVTLKVNGAASGLAATLGSADASLTILDGSASWPDLAAGQSAENTTAFQVRLAGTAACPADLAFTLDVTGTGLDPQQRTVALPLGGSGTGQAPLTIPDNTATGVTGGLTVSHGGTLSNLAVSVNITHTYVGDLKLVLKHPDGTQAVLLDRPGVPVTGFGCGDDNMNVRFIDSASTVLESRCAATNPWYTGDALPVNALSTLANRPSAQGEWQLIVSDFAGGDTGSVIEWELTATELQNCTACVAITEPAILLTAVDAANGNATPDTATLVRQADGSSSFAYVREGADGVLVKRVAFDASLVPAALASSASFGGSAAQEVVLLGTFQNGTAVFNSVVETRDAVTGVRLSRLTFSDTSARDLAIFKDATAQLVYAALVERRSDGRAQVRFASPTAGALSTLLLEPGLTGTAITALPPAGAGAQPRYAVLGMLSGRPRVAIYEYANSTPIKRFYAQATGFDARDIAPAGTAGSSVAVLAFSAGGNRASVQIRGASDGVLASTISMPSALTPLALFNAGNIDGAGADELAIAMLLADGRAQLFVHDSGTAARTLSRALATGAIGKAAALVGSLGGSAAPELAVVKKLTVGGALRIEGRDLGSGDLTMNYAAAPP